MVLVHKFRVFNKHTKHSSPWHKVKIKVSNVEALKAVREQLGERVFVRPADIDLCFVEVSKEALHRRINYKR